MPKAGQKPQIKKAPTRGKNSKYTVALENGEEIEITAKQYLFAQEYLKDLNATQAAIRSGYSQKSAGTIGFELLKKPDIRKVIEQHEQSLADEVDISTNRILAETALIAFAKPSRNGAVTTSNKLKALELLGKHKKLWTDRVEVESGVNQQARVKSLVDDFKASMFALIQERRKND